MSILKKISEKSKEKKIRKCMFILDDVTKNESHAKEKINTIYNLSKYYEASEAINGLFLTLKDETREEIAFTAAAALASAIQNNSIEEFIIDKFKKMKNIHKPMGQIPQVRILYVFILSDSKHIVQSFTDNDYSDDESRDVLSKRKHLIEFFKNGNIEEMCKLIMWFEALDAACNVSLLKLASQLFPEYRKYFNQMISLC